MPEQNVFYASRAGDGPGGTTVYRIDAGEWPHGTDPRPGDDRIRARDPGVEELDPRTDLANHSPTGFSWGYGGSGPAQLALAILADSMGDEAALEHYQGFKSEVVAAQPDGPLLIGPRDLPEAAPK